MSETQEASIGWGGEFHLSTDNTEANLVELVQVVSFDLPEVQVDQVETTHLKSEDRFKEFLDALADGGTVAIVMNFRPGSDTDEMLDDWEESRGKRKIRFVVPLLGVPAKTYTVSATFAGYARGNIAAGAKMESTLSVKISGSPSKAAA